MLSLSCSMIRIISMYMQTGHMNDQKSIFVSTFYDYIEMINSDGSKPLGWPLSLEGSSFQGGPLLYDIDGTTFIHRYSYFCFIKRLDMLSISLFRGWK